VGVVLTNNIGGLKYYLRIERPEFMEGSTSVGTDEFIPYWMILDRFVQDL
jgi:hypothetical protein